MKIWQTAAIFPFLGPQGPQDPDECDVAIESVQKRQNLGLIHEQKNPRFAQKMAY